MKTCAKCKVNKELSEYTKSEGNYDGLSGICIPCVKELQGSTSVVAKVVSAFKRKLKKK